MCKHLEKHSDKQKPRWICQEEIIPANMISFHGKLMSFVDRGRAAAVIYLEFNKAFDTVANKILIK